MTTEDLTPTERFRQLIEECNEGSDVDTAAAILLALKVNKTATWVLLPIVTAEVRRHERRDDAGVEREAFAGHVVTMSTRERLVGRSFLTGPGKRVDWLDATIEDHEARIAYQRGLMGAISNDVDNHELAIKAILEHGVTCLREIPEQKRPAA